MKVQLGTANEDQPPERKIFVKIEVNEQVYTPASIDARIKMLQIARRWLVKNGVK
jgi:hypothetical protein